MSRSATPPTGAAGSFLPTALTPTGLEVRIDLRLASLAAALTVGASPAPSEHPLVTTTRSQLAPYIHHPAVRWLQETLQRTWLLGMVMQTVQLDDPPTFAPHPLEQVPLFVQHEFAEPAAADLGPQLARWWREADLASLFAAQHALWAEVITDLASVLEPLDLVAFQVSFFGRFPFHPVAVPLANQVPTLMKGLGVANTTETYAICLLNDTSPYHAHPAQIYGLVQHEASHPILAEIQQRYPTIVADCAFLETLYPPSGRFVQIYDTLDGRWTETLIAASTYFFLQELGRPVDAEEHRQAFTAKGATLLPTAIVAISPWWRERRSGRAPGLEEVLGQLPDWFRQQGGTDQ